MTRRASLVAVLPLDRDGRPAVGGDISVEDAGWYSLWPMGREAAPDVFAHARDQGGVWVVLGAPETLALIERSAEKTWPGIEALRDDTAEDAVALKAVWIDERPPVLGDDGKPTEERVGEKVALHAAMAGWVEDDGEKLVTVKDEKLVSPEDEKLASVKDEK